MSTATTVTLAEAVPLVAALAARVADEAGIRLLLIKGQPATDLGVRAVRPSIDVDVWVAPGRHAEYIAALVEHGWSQASSTPAGVGWGHAVTLCHPTWPTTIDVHRFFPGFLEDQRIVFDLVWDRHTDRAVAHRALACPDMMCALVITALHATRSQGVAEADADTVVARRTADALSASEREALMTFLEASGAATTVGHSIPSLEAGAAAPDHLRSVSSEWRLRTDPGHTGVSWLLAFGSAPWRRWPGLLLAAARPTPADYAGSFVGSAGWRHGVRATTRRWQRGMAALPSGVRLVRAEARRTAVVPRGPGR